MNNKKRDNNNKQQNATFENYRPLLELEQERIQWRIPGIILGGR